MKNCERIKVAVIDGYVNTNLIKEKVYKKSFLNETAIDINTHGTVVVAKIIDEYPDVEITCIEILNNSNRCRMGSLIKALEYVAQQQFHIVNISLGCGEISIESKKSLQDICNTILKKGTIVFAAKSNKRGESFPADIDGIIKIGCDSYEKEIYSVDIKEKEIMFTRNSISLNANGIQGVYKGTSFLCPWVVGVFAHYLSQHMGNTQQIIEEFLLYLINLRNDYGGRILEAVNLDNQNVHIVQGKDAYLKGKMLEYFKPTKIVRVNDVNRLYLYSQLVGENLYIPQKVLVIDGFLCNCEREKKCIRKFILSLSRWYDQVIMYGNYFNLAERMEISKKTGKCFNSILY